MNRSKNKPNDERPSLVTNIYGTFLIRGGIVEQSTFFTGDKDAIFSKLERIEKGDVLEEEEQLASSAGGVRVYEKRLAKLGRVVNRSAPEIDIDIPDEIRDSIRQAMLDFSTKRLGESFGESDRLTQLVNSIEELDKTINLLMERLVSWSRIGKTSSHSINLEELLAGVKFDDKLLSALSGELLQLCKLRDKMKAECETITTGMAPRTSELIGWPVTSRLISRAGGLKHLAMLSSSGIQMLGAEKALFRHIRSGSKPPKHGIIYSLGEISRAPMQKRGKISRALSGKIAITARMDYFGSSTSIDGIKEELNSRLAQIRSRSG